MATILDVKQKERVFMLGNQVTQENVESIIKAIYEINMDDEEKEASYNGWERSHIHIILNTYGGSVYDGLALIGAIELSSTPVITTCLGSAMSMGLFILASGHMRRAHHLSTIMYHEMSLGAIDTIKGVKASVEEGERLTAMCENILFSRTKLKPKDLLHYKNGKADWFMTPHIAQKFGIIDEVIGTPLVSADKAKKIQKEFTKQENLLLKQAEALAAQNEKDVLQEKKKKKKLTTKSKKDENDQGQSGKD